MAEICMNPIGIVERDNAFVRDKDALSKIVLDEDLSQALEGVIDFSHLFILFWMHDVKEERRNKLMTHPRGRTHMPLVGVYATRTSSRRNPIGLTLVELVDVEKNVLIVRGLDAFNGTPILDIKPYDDWDLTINPIVPDWWKKL
jgi:tRNA-Thr(GGU) m(6)t(6)A37 methyltransferase TsaA